MKRSDEKQLLLSEIIYCISSDAPLHWTTAGIRAIEECKLCAEYILLNAIIYLFRLIREIRLNKIEKNRVEHLLKLILSVQSLFANAIKRTINCQWSSLSSINPIKINSLKIANYWKNFFYNFARDRILIKDKRLILNSTEI